MAKIQKFEEIIAWQKGRELTALIYGASGSGAFGKDFALRDQIRRAAISITSNIAEGFEGGGSKEFIQFLSIAKGSCGEVRSQLHLASDQGYLSKESYETLCDRCIEISRLIDGFLNYLRQSEIKGRKFLPPRSPMPLDNFELET